jgi:hypothetical protein
MCGSVKTCVASSERSLALLPAPLAVVSAPTLICASRQRDRILYPILLMPLQVERQVLDPLVVITRKPAEVRVRLLVFDHKELHPPDQSICRAAAKLPWSFTFERISRKSTYEGNVAGIL